jgi:predicted enzyme related to lactoylglutathione lyase
MHGANERIGVREYENAIRFYRNLIRAGHQEEDRAHSNEVAFAAPQGAGAAARSGAQATPRP